MPREDLREQRIAVISVHLMFLEEDEKTVDLGLMELSTQVNNALEGAKRVSQRSRGDDVRERLVLLDCLFGSFRQSYASSSAAPPPRRRYQVTGICYVQGSWIPQCMIIEYQEPTRVHTFSFLSPLNHTMMSATGSHCGLVQIPRDPNSIRSRLGIDSAIFTLRAS